MKHSAWIIFAVLALAAGVSFVLSLSARDHSKVDGSIEKGQETAYVKITDDLGRQVKLKAPVTRIVSCYSAFTVMLEQLDAAEYLLAATSRQSKRLGIPSVGNHLKPDVEAIVAVRPDLVILSSNRRQVVQSLERNLKPAGIKVLALHPESVDATLKRFSELGRIAGKEDRAERLLDEARARLARVEKGLADVSRKERPQVFLEVRSMPNLLTCGSDSVAYDVIRRAGGIPLYREPGSVKRVSLEFVVDREPDAYIQQRGVMNPNPVSPRNHSILKSLECVQKGRVKQMHEELISRPTLRLAEAVVSVYQFLYN